MFDIKKYLAESREIMSEDTKREMQSVDHELRRAITDFVWQPDANKKRHIVRLLDKYHDYWQLKDR